MEVISENKTKQQLPNANGTLVLGILSIVLSCGVIGFILGIIGLTISREGKELYDANPDQWTGYSSLQAGRVMSIIGVVIGSFAVLYLVIMIIIGGAIFGLATSHIF